MTASRAVTTETSEPSSGWRTRLGPGGWWYAAGVVAGAVLIVWAAVNQPYNQNELKQIEPYGSDDVDTITSGTRQPPLDALLGSFVQHVLGEGQLRQHLEPALAGIGTLVVLALLLRRLGLGRTGGVTLWLIATQPLMVHYSAYARPYALPVFLMVLFVYAALAWMQTERLRWLVLAGGASLALPLTRVPEPIAFLTAMAAVLAWQSLPGRSRSRCWPQTWPLVALPAAAVALIGYPMYRDLAADGPGFDPSPGGVVDRFGAGVSELWHHVLPWMGAWFPWWPITLGLVVTALALPSARHRLLREWGWAWAPLLAAPLVFLVAYHFMNPDGFELRPYRDRYAYFFIPAFALLVAALAAVLEDAREHRRATRVGVAVLLAVACLAQLPATAKVVTDNVSPDFVAAGRVLTETLPAEAIVVYAAPVPIGLWRQEFMSLQTEPSMPLVIDGEQVAKDPGRVPDSGQVYLLVLDGECANSVYCDKPTLAWDGSVTGWDVIARVDRFTLYAPLDESSGRAGVAKAMIDLAAVLGPEYGLLETYAAAGVLRYEGDEQRARSLLRAALSRVDPERAQTLRRLAERSGLTSP